MVEKSLMDCMNVFFALVARLLVQLIGGIRPITLARLSFSSRIGGWQTLETRLRVLERAPLKMR